MREGGAIPATSSSAEVADEEKNEPDKKISGPVSILGGLPGSVYVVFLVVFLITLGNLEMNPILFLYFASQDWVNKSADDFLYYTLILIVGTVSPIILGPLFGLWQSRRGKTKEPILFETVCCLVGFAVMAFTNNRWLFLVAYLLSRMPLGQRAVRTTYVLAVTDVEEKTRAMSLAPITSLLGAILAPLITLLCSLAPDPEHSWYIVGDIKINQLNLPILISTYVTLARLVITVMTFKELSSDINLQSDKETRTIWDGEYQVMHFGKQITVHSSTVVWGFVGFLSGSFFLLQVTFGSLIVTLQPLLVGKLNFGLVEMSLFILTLAFTSLIPSIAIAILSKKGLPDRYLMITGTVFMIGVAFLYTAPPMHGWQTISGGVLIIPALLFYSIPVNALFSKVLGPRASGTKMGILSSAMGLGPVVGTLLGNFAVRTIYGKPLFMAFVIPAGLGLVALVAGFRYLDPELPLYVELRKPNQTNADGEVNQYSPYIIIDDQEEEEKGDTGN